jgi:deoxyribose-phosphate aldolase
MTLEDRIDSILKNLDSTAVSCGCSAGQSSCACQAAPCGHPECKGSAYCLRPLLHMPDEVDNVIECGACRISSSLGISPAREKVARMIDHTLLKPEATLTEIDQLCREAKTYCFASVCVNPCWVRHCADALKNSGVMVCTVVGFPLGATNTLAKGQETAAAIAQGAREIDMVINIGWLKSGLYDLVKKDIQEVVRNAGRRAPVKVILETCLLTDEEKIKACVLAREAGAAYVKTSTGFSKGGATAADVALMRHVVGESMGVKASGGVRTYEDAVQMVSSGATRIGASASVKIVSGNSAAVSAY